MVKTWVISDTHFSHPNIIKFTDADGNLIRPHPETGGAFQSTIEHDEYIINRWNELVSPDDRVYHLGDFSMKRNGLNTLHRLQGRICLVGGNHDPWRLEDYKHFDNLDFILGVKVFPKIGFVLSHMPIHPNQLHARFRHNVHGHLHNLRVKDPVHSSKDDPRYINVSCEHTGLAPVELDTLIK